MVACNGNLDRKIRCANDVRIVSSARAGHAAFRTALVAAGSRLGEREGNLSIDCLAGGAYDLNGNGVSDSERYGSGVAVNVKAVNGKNESSS